MATTITTEKRAARKACMAFLAILADVRSGRKLRVALRNMGYKLDRKALKKVQAIADGSEA